MHILKILMPLLVVVAFAGSAFAVPSGEILEYIGGSAGKVIFDGKAHEGSMCDDCHTKIFPDTRGIKITMADMNAGQKCGVCHNGEKAFKSSDPANCGICHKK